MGSFFINFDGNDCKDNIKFFIGLLNFCVIIYFKKKYCNKVLKIDGVM